MMQFTKEEIKNIEALLLSPIEDNVKLAFAILEGKECPEEIKILLDEYQEIYQCIYPNMLITLEEICLMINQSEKIEIDTKSSESRLHKKIIYIHSQDNKFPDVFKKMTSLECLCLNRNIEPENLNFLVDLNNLNFLDFSYSNLEQLPPSLNKLKNLERVWLRGINLSQPDFAILATLTNLKDLDLEDSNLTQLPLGLPSTLETLCLNDNDLSKADFSILNSLKNLKILTLNNCDLQELPQVLEQLTKLEILDLGYNDLGIVDFSILLSLENLKEVRINNFSYPEFIPLPHELVQLQNKGVKILV